MTSSEPPSSPAPGSVPPLGPDLPATPEPGRGAGWRSWVIAAVVVAVVAGGVGYMLSRSSSSSNAAATTPQSSESSGAPFAGGARRGARGTVTKLDGSDITVQTTDQSGSTSTTVVRTSNNTTYTQSASGSIGDLKAGDNIVVTGNSSNGSVVATSIRDMGSMTFGRGGSRNGGNGNGGPPTDFSGAPPNFSGAPPNNGNFPGGAPEPGQAGNSTAGKITAIDGSTVTVSSFNGDAVTVTTDGSTTYTVTKSASLADIKVGDTITAAGETSNGVVTATAIRIGDDGFGPGGFGGGGFGGGRRSNPNASSQSGN